MLALEEILCELNGEIEMNNEQGLPPGFRFHPTDEELITFYLASKVFNPTFSAGVEIAEVDLNRCEPWELPDVAKMGEREWYFFSLRDRKYPTGLRTNRATGAGYWKATGKDREVYSTSSSNGGAGSASNGGQLLGMKKTLVFYKGRAPRGEKTKWVMHEYRLDGDFSCRHTCKEEWVICRIFHKMGEKKNGVALQGQSSHYLQEEASITSSSPSKTGQLELQPHKPIQSLQNQNPFLINDHHHENDLKTLVTINNISSSVGDAAVSQAFPINPINGGYQTSFSPTRNNYKEKEDTNNKQSPSSFFKSLLSDQQDYYYYYYNYPTSFKEQQIAPLTSTIIPKHCKTEPNFSHFDHFSSNDHNAAILRCPNPPDYNNNYKIQQQNPTSSSYHQSPFLFGTMNTNGGFPSAAAGADANLHEMSTSSSSSTSGVLAFNRAGFHQMLLDSSIKLAAGESWPFHF